MPSETHPVSPKQLKVKEMLTRVMIVAELLSKASENHDSQQQSVREIPQKTQK